MGRCTNNDLVSGVGINKVDKHTRVAFAALTDVDRCTKVNAKNYIEYNADAAVFNQYEVPADMFNCLAEGCRNTGTLMLRGAAGSAVSAKFPVGYDATEFFLGLATYYINVPAGKYTVKTTMSDITNPAQTNADVYVQTVEPSIGGAFPIIVDFSKEPNTVIGSGWSGITAGAIISVEIQADDASVVADFGVSSFYFYDTLEDFEVNDLVLISCINGIEGDLTGDPTDATCFGGGLDPSSLAIEKTVAGGKVTPNYHKLNPAEMKGDKTSGWTLQPDTRKVQTITINGVEYGYIQVPDMQIEECAFVSAQIENSCNITDSMLSRVSVPTLVTLNERQFQVLDGTVTDIHDAGKILFHKSLVGQNILVTYPKKAVVEQYIGTDEAVEGKRVRMFYTVCQTDGVKITYVFNNVLITSFPMTINAEETVFSFTISIQRDRNNRFYERYRVVE